VIITESNDRQIGMASRAQTKALTRAKLLEAARDIFVTAGYRGATLDSIAARAGFTKGAVYWHFPNKQALFLALVADSIAANFVVIERMFKDHSDDPDALRAALGAYIDRIDEHETLPVFGVDLEIEARSNPSFRTLHQNMIDKHEVGLAKFLSYYFAVIKEEPPMPLDQLAATLIALLKGFALSRQNRNDMPVTSAAAVRLLLGLSH
jgi:AcrR family transcriptional regulator